MDLGAAAAAVAGAELSAHRMAVHRLPSGAVLIDDSYNANPVSMAAALDALVAVPATRRVAVVGLMAELEDAPAAHRQIADQAARHGIELVAVGTELYGVDACADPVAAVAPLGAGTAVLVKASRVAALDQCRCCHRRRRRRRVSRDTAASYLDAVTTDSASTSELTMATLAKLAADRYGDALGARYLRDGQWAAAHVQRVVGPCASLALGLVDLGVEVGDRVAIACNTRVEFTIADLAASTAGAVVVPVYPSNSADECDWVVGNSGSKVIVCEDAGQVDKIAERA